MKVAILLIFMSFSAHCAQWIFTGKVSQIETDAAQIRILTDRYPEILNDMGFDLEDVKGVTINFLNYDFDGEHSCEVGDVRLSLSLFSYKVCLLENHNLCYTSSTSDLPSLEDPCL